MIMKIKLRIAAAIAALQFVIFPVMADEGMWLPVALHSALEDDMQRMGMKLSAEDIYSVNRSSLKDAIVNFGGCTASMISPDGLLLTNHHCGYSYIQSHSSIENDLLTKGFWARSMEEELPNSALKVYFIRQIDDVTQVVLKDIEEDTKESVRQKLVSRRMDSLVAATKGSSHYDVMIRPFFHGNEYYMFITETFYDVRLVGAPPSSIGKFGGDTDNWMWPRHTGDFSLFRIYTGPDGKPAPYHEENVPYHPGHYLPVNLEGVKPGDFTMIFGFPGRTTQYLVSPSVDFLVNKLNPHRIAIREAKIKTLNAAMSGNDTIRIQYAAKYARVSNAYKKWIGENMGLKRFNAVQRKVEEEKAFEEWVALDEARKKRFDRLIPRFKQIYEQREQPSLLETYVNEAVFGVDIMHLALSVLRFTEQKEKPDQTARERLTASIDSFFKDFDLATDRRLFVEMMSIYLENMPGESAPAILQKAAADHNGSLEEVSSKLYASSLLLQKDELKETISSTKREDMKRLRSDPFVKLCSDFFAIANKQTQPLLFQSERELELLYRKYVQGVREMHADSVFSPDANGVMRIAYGKMEGSAPWDGMKYLPFTTLQGVMQKEDPSNAEFFVEEKLKRLYKEKDYGAYGRNDTMYVCFLASNHTTGGNSGSPVIDAEGNLIGLNFDRTWESTMSDVMYNGTICRNISVDIRYILFIIDKFAGAGYLIDEMTIAHEEIPVNMESN